MLNVSEMERDEWDGVRAELEATTLVRVELDGQGDDDRYLRLHPTLPYAAANGIEASAMSSPSGVEGVEDRHHRSDSESARQRFIKVYAALSEGIGVVLHVSNARSGMEVLRLEEMNFLKAILWAVQTDQCDVAAAMGNTLSLYLEFSARLRERDQLLAWLAEAATQISFSPEAAKAEIQGAWSQFTQGQADEAVERLEALIDRLRHTDTFDPAFELAIARSYLGRVYDNAGRTTRGISVLEEAVQDWETLFGQAVSLSSSETINDLLRSDAKDDQQRLEAGGEQLVNLSATLGDLANALRNAGRLDEALDAAKRSAAIRRVLGHVREGAVGLGQIAHILMEQGRYREADAHYDECLRAARRVGDKNLESTTLQHQGGLAHYMNDYERAVDLYTQALKVFQEANDDGAVMQIYNMLGLVEGDQGQPREANSLGQLAQLYLLTGELDKAEVHADRSRQIFEDLGLKEVVPVYELLADIARTQGDESQAAHWEAKRDEMRADLARRAQGGDASGVNLPQQMIEAITQLAVACIQAGLNGSALSSDAESAVAQLDQSDAGPLQPLGSYLRRLATGPGDETRAALTMPPADLPEPLPQLFAQLHDAMREAEM
ncbi:tetratricopeptide repeat protein [Candidatus Entotheonella palauensis]|uniref:tetratricopeptide repeat protein n=1 Tax=Candidatus Entotheonella palauensis TaxID=93172 RepID=UPI0015C49589|nr:tetratricopeptide repeat protein [Candidatus Entotheonella palauensis]